MADLSDWGHSFTWLFAVTRSGKASQIQGSGRTMLGLWDGNEIKRRQFFFPAAVGRMQLSVRL
jgi:hypothetical protein